MAQTINVDISTRGAPPVAYTHQGDTDRTFLVNVFENGEAFGVAGFTVKVAAILPGDSGYTVITGSDMVSATKTTTGTNQLMFTPSANYTARSGRGILTLIMTTNTGTPATIRPINIDFRIQKSADGPDVIAGASDFPEGLEEIAESVFQEYLSTYLPPVAPSSSADANKAASAKLTGQELDNLKSDLDKSTLFSTSNMIDVEQGYWAAIDGTPAEASTWCRTGYLDTNAVIMSENLRMFILAYDIISGAFVGTWDGSAFTPVYNADSYLKYFNMDEWVKTYPNYRFKINFFGNNTQITPSDVYTDIEVRKLNEILLDTTMTQTSLDRTNEEIWATGYWEISDGAYVSSNNWIRSNQTIPNDVVFINSDSKTYKIILLAYEGTTYIGAWFGHGFVKNYDYSYVRTSVNLEEFRSKYPTYTFRVSITKVQGGSIVLADAVSDLVLQMSYTKKHEMDIKTITGDIADASLWENGSLTASGDKVVVDSIFYQRLTTISFLRFVVPVTVCPKDGYVYSVTTYDANGTKIDQFSEWMSIPFTFSADKLYRISIKSTSNENLISTNISTYVKSTIWKQTPFDRMLAEFANIKAVNHRGYNKFAPENTLPAFDMSALFGYKYVETDVLFTSDGVPVLMHDATINRTCCNADDGSAIEQDLTIASLSYNELLSYDACTPSQWSKWKGTKIPTFAEFMQCCRANNLHAWIELKNEKIYTQSEIQEIISIVKQYGMEEHVTFISFSFDALNLVKSEWDTVELGINGTVENATRLKTGKNRVFMLFEQSSSSYGDAVSNGFQICFYTINNASSLLVLPTNAYDSVLTNTLLPNQICNTELFKYDQMI